MTATTGDTEQIYQKAQSRQARHDEMAVLGAMMMAAPGSGVPGEIRELLTPGNDLPGVGEHHFVIGRHQLIWATIIRQMTAALPLEPLAVAAALPVEKLHALGGVGYLHSCIEQCPTVLNGPYYAQIVANATVLRQIGEACAATARQAAGTALATEFVEDTLDAAHRTLDRIQMPGRSGALVTWDELSDIAVDQMQQPHPEFSDFSTPWPDLNDMLGPVPKGALILIAARPGLGKSVVARDLFIHLALRRRLPSAFFSLEMSKLEIGLAMIANIAKVPLRAIKNGTLSDDDWAAVGRKGGEVRGAPGEIDDTPRINTAYIDRAIGTAERKHGRRLAAYFLDYLQLSSEKGHNNRQEEVSAMSRGNKLLAKERETVAVVLSQLNRGPEQRPDKRPQLSDLRESGSLEQDADIVLLLHRDDYYDPECPNAGIMEIHVAKNRGGPTGMVEVGHQLHLSRIVSLAL